MDRIEALLASAQARTETVRICARADLVARHAEAVEAYNQALSDDDSLANDSTREAAAAVKAIEDEQEESTVEFTVSAISRRAWSDLVAQHPPSAEQRRAGHPYDPSTFSVAMVAACVTDPPMTEEQAQRLSDTLHTGEWNKLENVAFWLNTTATPSPKLSAATELLQMNGRSSTTSVPDGSRDPGSLAGSGEQ